MWAITGSTAAFAAIHLAGLIGGATLEATPGARPPRGLPFGLAFAGLSLTSRSIWPLVVIHPVDNFTSWLMGVHWEAVSQDMSRFALVSALQLALVVVLLGYGVRFLWRFSRSR